MGKGQLAGLPNWLKRKINKLEMTFSDVAIPLLLSDWILNEENGTYTQNITVNGVEEDTVPVIALSSVADIATEEELNAYACISDIVTSENTITFIANELPSISFTVVAKSVANSNNNTVSDVTELVGKINELETEVGELTTRFTNVDEVSFVKANERVHITNMENTKFVPMYADDFMIADVGTLRDVINNINSQELLKQIPLTSLTGGTQNAISGVAWQDYNLIIFDWCHYTNTQTNLFVPYQYFAYTTSGARPFLYNPGDANASVGIWQNGAGNIIINPSPTAVTFTNHNLRIWGIGKRF